MKYRSWAEIDLKNLTENINAIQSFLKPGTAYLQVVKADAYGHGSIEVSRRALNNNAVFLGVANSDEGVQLRLAEVNAPVLILSPSFEFEIEDIIKYNLTPSVSSVKFAGAINKFAEKSGISIPVHVEIDTGMGRTGFHLDSAFEKVKKLADLRNLSLEGMFSHFPASEFADDPESKKQIKQFKELVNQLKSSGINIPIIHMANSGGIINYPKSHFNMVRSGLMTFGEYPGDDLKSKIKLKQVMSFKTRVVVVRDFKKGETISYRRTYKCTRRTRVAIVPIGYGDGYGFVLSNKGSVLINGSKFPIIGRVTMDLTMIDVTGDKTVKPGDEVTLIGRSGREKITAEEIAGLTGSLNYSVLCSIGKRAPRIYLNKSRIEDLKPIMRRKDITSHLISNSRLDELIKHSLQLRLNEEVGNSLYHAMFQSMFSTQDEPMVFRKNFKYKIKLSKFTPDHSRKLKASIRISYNKVFKQEQFIIACTDTEQKLERLFSDPKVEYRWFLENSKDLQVKNFNIKEIKLDNQKLNIKSRTVTSRGLEYVIQIPAEKRLLNRIVQFQLTFETVHYKENTEFPVYIVHPTRGFKVEFHYPGLETGSSKPRVFTFFAGKQRYPEIKYKKKSISITGSGDEWIFPNSGLLIYWENIK